MPSQFPRLGGLRCACSLARIYGRKPIARVQTVPGFSAVDFKIAIRRAFSKMASMKTMRLKSAADGF